jgi:hypothetical protein
MRISKHDRLFDVYQQAQVMDAEGYPVMTLTRTREGLPSDLQPIGGRVKFEMYGLDTVSAEARRMFFDQEEPVYIGDIVQDTETLKTYMVKGLHAWYDHTEAIIEPYRIAI